MQIRDVMTRQPITAFDNETVHEAARRMYHHGVSALPVVDGKCHVVGIVSEGDLLHRRELATEKHRSWWLELFMGQDERAHEYLKESGNLVRDVMTKSVDCLSPEASLAQAAEHLECKHIKRMPIVKDDRLVGILSRADLIRALAIHYVPRETPPADEAALRDRFYEELTQASIAPSTMINAITDKHTIYLWGMVDTETEKMAVEALARQLPGVKGVENNLIVRPVLLSAE